MSIHVGEYAAIKYDDGTQSTVVGRVIRVTQTEAVFECGTAVKLERIVRTSPRECGTCGLQYMGDIVEHAEDRAHTEKVKSIRGW